MRPEARTAARKQAIEEGKEKRAAAQSIKKAEKAKTAAAQAKGQATGRYVNLTLDSMTCIDKDIVLSESRLHEARHPSPSPRHVKRCFRGERGVVLGTARLGVDSNKHRCMLQIELRSLSSDIERHRLNFKPFNSMLSLGFPSCSHSMGHTLIYMFYLECSLLTLQGFVTRIQRRSGMTA